MSVKCPFSDNPAKLVPYGKVQYIYKTIQNQLKLTDLQLAQTNHKPNLMLIVSNEKISKIDYINIYIIL